MVMNPAGAGSTVSESLAMVAPGRPMLDYLPIGLFGSVMGVTGLSMAWRLAHQRFGVPVEIALAIAAVAGVAFVGMTTGYVIKLLTAFNAVRQEFHHPIAGNLFGTVLISLLQLPIVLAPYALRLAQIMWAAGATGMVFFAWLIVSRWMSHRQQVVSATPAWIVPVVGLLNVPLALPVLDLPPLHGLMVAALAIGLFFAVPLFTLIFSRLLFDPALPAAQRPTLLFLAAPFAVSYSTYTVVVGRTDLIAEAIYALTLFVLAVLLGQLRDLPSSCPFRLSWWAVSFPLAASSVAALRFADAQPGIVTDTIALSLLTLASVVIVALLVVTLLRASKGGLRNLST